MANGNGNKIKGRFKRTNRSEYFDQMDDERLYSQKAGRRHKASKEKVNPMSVDGRTKNYDYDRVPFRNSFIDRVRNSAKPKAKSIKK